MTSCFHHGLVSFIQRLSQLDEEIERTLSVRNLSTTANEAAFASGLEAGPKLPTGKEWSTLDHIGVSGEAEGKTFSPNTKLVPRTSGQRGNTGTTFSITATLGRLSLKQPGPRAYSSAPDAECAQPNSLLWSHAPAMELATTSAASAEEEGAAEAAEAAEADAAPGVCGIS